MRRSAKVNHFQKAAKIKAAVKAHPLKNIRRAFRDFSTEEAWTFVVRLNGKRMFCRVDRTKNSKELAERNRLVLDLFHRLYPKNSLTPVGITRVSPRAILGYYPEEFEFKNKFHFDDLNQILKRRANKRIRGVQKFPIYGVVTKIERRQSPDFKKYQAELRGYVRNLSEASKRHIEFEGQIALPVSKKIFNESGIRSEYVGNISNVGGNPIFFEPKITAPKRLITFIQSKPAIERAILMQIVQRLGLVH